MTDEPIQGRTPAERLRDESAAWYLFRTALVLAFVTILWKCAL